MLQLGVRENRIVNGNQVFGPHNDSKTNMCVCVREREWILLKVIFFLIIDWSSYI